MAGGARQTGVRPGQREQGSAVIEYRARPGCCIVTGRTLFRESCRRMVRICCAAVIGEMAGITIRWKPRIYAARMAGSAQHAGMRAGQRKRSCTVVKCCALPGRRIMTGRALLRESRCRMVRVCRAVIVC